MTYYAEDEFENLVEIDLLGNLDQALVTVRVSPSEDHNKEWDEPLSNLTPLGQLELLVENFGRKHAEMERVRAEESDEVEEVGEAEGERDEAKALIFEFIKDNYKLKGRGKID
jgi:hypothetical protein